MVAAKYLLLPYYLVEHLTCFKRSLSVAFKQNTSVIHILKVQYMRITGRQHELCKRHFVSLLSLCLFTVLTSIPLPPFLFSILATWPFFIWFCWFYCQFFNWLFGDFLSCTWLIFLFYFFYILTYPVLFVVFLWDFLLIFLWLNFLWLWLVVVFVLF